MEFSRRAVLLLLILDLLTTGLAEICTSYSYLVQPYVDPPCNPVLSSESTLTLRCVVQAQVEVDIFWFRNSTDITAEAADDIGTWSACDPGYMCTQSDLQINRFELPGIVIYRCAILIPGVEGPIPPSEGFIPDHTSDVDCGSTVYTNETKCVQPEIIINVLSPTSTAEYHQQSASSQTKTESTTQLPSLYHVSSVTSSLVLSPTTPSPTISGSTEYSHTASETVTSATQQGSSSEVLLYATVGVVGGLLMIIVTLVVTIATTCVYILYLKKRNQDESNKIEMEENAAYGPTGAHPTADQDPDYEEIPDAKDIFDTTGNMAYGIVV